MRPVFTEDGKAVVKDFIANLAALQKEVVDAGKGIAYEDTLPTEEDILQDILLFEEELENGIYYPAVEDGDYGEWLFLKYGEDYIWR